MKSFIKIISAVIITVTTFQTAAAQQPAYSDISISAIKLTAAGAVKKVALLLFVECRMPMRLTITKTSPIKL